MKVKILHLPGISVVLATGISKTSAVSGGDVLDVGSPSLTARGVCWSSEPNPTIIDFIT